LSCQGTTTCNIECPTGGCTVDCKDTAAQCKIVCGTPASCTYSCAAGQTTTCEAGTTCDCREDGGPGDAGAGDADAGDAGPG
jgi:hypothetical protein